MSEKKYVQNPIQFLRQSGLLFEINRHILHPFGLAMVVDKDKDSDTDEGKFYIWDEREDKEGIVYDADTFISGTEKINTFLEDFGVEKLLGRQEELGFTHQESPDPYIKANGVSLLTYHPSFNPEEPNSPELLGFKVPYLWLDAVSLDLFDWTANEFTNEYTYDTAQTVYNLAKEEGCVTEEEDVT